MEVSTSAADGAAAASHDGAAGVGGGSGGGAPIFPPGRPLKGINSHTKTFTKRFYFKIYANDWKRIVSGSGAETSTKIVHFGTFIPYQALCMYLSPQEYMETVRGSHYARITEANFELKFKAIRTPFDANSTDAAEANGNLQFEIQRWDGLEHMLPFQTLDFEGRDSDTITPRTSYNELIERLYGKVAFGGDNRSATDYKWPATMRERGLSWRPVWNFIRSRFDYTSPYTGMYRTVNQYISSLPIGEYVTDCMNTNVAKMSEGYCFNKTYKPKNGLLSFASSAASTTPAGTKGGKTRINTKVRFQDTVMEQTSNPVPGSRQYDSLFGADGTVLEVIDKDAATYMKSESSGNLGHGGPRYAATQRPGQELQYLTFTAPAATGGVWQVDPDHPLKKVVAAETGGDAFGFGYNNEMAYYSIANLENYTMFTPSVDPPVHHMPSMVIGIVPKTNSDESIVKATAEFECTTSITIMCDDTHPTYVNCSYSGGRDGYPATYADPYFNDLILYGGRWQHNEKEVCLRDNKYWNGDYGLAGKPIFQMYDYKAPLMNN